MDGIQELPVHSAAAYRVRIIGADSTVVAEIRKVGRQTIPVVVELPLAELLPILPSLQALAAQ